ncbi:MAG TPA: hypothetical protein VMF67_09960 [Rhizomicrobium sp.]|nr:hypothetical protein [Rhizomicrobium sp.]
MVPDFRLRIQSMLRAMQEVVIPAIPAGERLALDQASIVVGNLKLMAEQQDKLYRYELVELREYAALVTELIDAAGGGASTEAARESLRNSAGVVTMPIPTQPELTGLTKAMKHAADTLLRAAYEDGSPEFRRAAAQLVMKQSASQITRERSWFRAAGFELEPESLPPLDELLA